MYQDWKKTIMKVDETSRKFYKKITSPVDQEAIIWLEYRSERQYPSACSDKNDGHYLNVRMKEIVPTLSRKWDSWKGFTFFGKGWSVNFGYKKVSLKAGVTYKL